MRTVCCFALLTTRWSTSRGSRRRTGGGSSTASTAANDMPVSAVRVPRRQWMPPRTNWADSIINTSTLRSANWKLQVLTGAWRPAGDDGAGGPPRW